MRFIQLNIIPILFLVFVLSTTLVACGVSMASFFLGLAIWSGFTCFVSLFK